MMLTAPRTRGHYHLAALVLALVQGAWCCCGCELERDVTVIKLAHGLDTQHPVHKAMVLFGQHLEQRSAGTMRVDVYSGGQLGSERECIELLQIGGLGMTKTSSAALEGFSPGFKVFGLPYIFRDEAHQRAVLEGPLGRELLDSPTNVFLRGLCYYDAGSRSFYTRSRPIRSPEDLAGLKIRTQESPVAFRMIRALGGTPTPIAWGELYTALQQGIVDGAENNPPTFHLSRQYEICRYYSLNEHARVPDVLLISEHLWRGLSDEQRQWVREAAELSAAHQRVLWAEATEQALRAVSDAGVQIVRPDPAPFRQRTEPVRAELAAADPLMAALIRRIAETQP